MPKLSKGFDKARKYSPFYVRGTDGRKQYFKLEKDRDTEFNKRAKRLALYGSIEVQISGAERRLFGEMREEAQRAGLSVRQIFDAGLRSAVPHASSMIVRDVVEEFLAECDSRVQKGRLSNLTASGYRQFLNRFCGVAGDRPMMGVLPFELERFAADNQSATTERNCLVALRRLWLWAIKKRLIAGPSPFDQIEIGIPPRGEPTVFTVEQTARVLHVCRSEHEELMPLMILQWFAGIRPMTSVRLHWENIRFDARAIRIPAAKGKVKARANVIVDLPDAFWVWMEPYRKTTGLIAPRNARRRMKAFHVALGYDHKENPWPEDVARHSFATYLLDLYKSLSRVAIILGHRGHNMLLDHYRGLEIAVGDGTLYFDLRPDSVETASRDLLLSYRQRFLSLCLSAADVSTGAI